MATRSSRAPSNITLRRDRRRPAPPGARARHRPRGQPLRGPTDHPDLQPVDPRTSLRAHTGAPERPPDRGAGSRPRPAHLVPFVHLHRSRRTSPTDPLRRSAHPVAQAAPCAHLQHHVGHHRLHRGQRRHSPRPWNAPRRPLTQPSRALRLDPRRDAQGKRARLGGSLWHGGGANTTDRAPSGDRHELLRRLLRQQENQQLGIPLERASSLPPATPGARRLLHLQRLIGHIDKQHPGKLLLGTDPDSTLVWDYAKGPDS